MRQGESIINHFGRVITVANDMTNYGEDVDDVNIVEKILRTLTNKWDYIVCSIVETKYIYQLSVDALQSSLLVHEQKFKVSGEDEHDLKVIHEESYGGKGRGRSTFQGGRGQGIRRGSQPRSKETIECCKCHKLGHFQYECQANYIGLKESEEMVLVAYVDTLGDDRDFVWYIDYGCNNHMCGDS
ncbi:uncharacterized protein LOC127095076 [Lathyrus oleraceus]|uniref:uncharacterized protein LOC127095076 n=1 Tax=Pisum sativum TaxID=3888 RepID=UPI0021D1879F|nr:uncharacterized protein LOC127095076 [Pisum sativum]